MTNLVYCRYTIGYRSIRYIGIDCMIIRFGVQSVMKIETYIDSLVSYAMNAGLAEPVDHQVLTNRLLDLLRLDDYTPSDELLIEDLEEILKGILDYAVSMGLCDDGITA